MRMPELKSLARERRLRNYSPMRKAELVALLQNNPPPAPRTRPPRPTRPPPPPTQTWEPIDDRRLRKPSPQEMDIFKQQEISKSRPQVKTKLNRWYDWLINHVPKPIKDGASKAFKTFKDKVMRLHNRVTAWIRFVRDDEEGQERVELAFNSLMMSVYRRSKTDQIVDRMIANMKFQI